MAYKKGIPRNPIGKHILNRNKKTTATIRAFVLFGLEVVPARIDMHIHMPAALDSISLPRPNRSIVKKAMKPPTTCISSMAAERILESVAERDRSCWKMVVA